MTIGLKLIFTGAAVATLALALVSEVSAQDAAPAEAARVAFLQDNVVVSGPVSGGFLFDFPPAFYESRLILLGESHGVAAPQRLDLELLMHLNAQIGLRHYLAEMDPVQAETLNQYLLTGDETLLDRVFDHWTATGAQWGNLAFEAKVREIRAFNVTKSSDDAVRFIGIDAIQDWPLLTSWIRDRGGSVSLQALGTAEDNRTRAGLALAGIEGTSEDGTVVALRGVLADVAAGLGREATIFNANARSVRGGELADQPAYGLWGLFHVLQAGVGGGLPFAARVAQSDLPTANAVTSILIYALESGTLLSYPGPTEPARMRLDTLNVDGPYINLLGASDLKAASEPTAITVFHAGAPGTPYGGGGHFVDVRTSLGQNLIPETPAAPFSAYAQYVGVFRGSDWAPPRDLESPSVPALDPVDSGAVAPQPIPSAD